MHKQATFRTVDNVLAEFITASSGLYIGIDEAAAGCYAGSLTVAGAILDPANPIIGLNDSKKLSQAKRESLYDIIVEKALHTVIVTIPPAAIDKSNILICRMNGMRQVALALAMHSQHCIVDGNQIPSNMPVDTHALIKGDDQLDSVRAASIIAKVTHDNDMKKAAIRYPDFGFDKHKGYGTKAHQLALDTYGPNEYHRYSYKPVAKSAALHGIASSHLR